jgi:hypothetical protein
MFYFYLNARIFHNSNITFRHLNMAQSKNIDNQKELLRYLAKVTSSQPQILERESWGGRVRLAKCEDYPRSGLTTFMTLGASELCVSLYRGRTVGFELTMTLAKEDPGIVDTLATTVVENLRLATSKERRPFIEYNGIYAMGYPPHFLFTEQITITPSFSGRNRVGQNYISFLAAIPLDDREVREYDRSVPALIEKLRSTGRIAEYPRSSKKKPTK